MNYLPANAAFARTLKDPALGYVSRYALGRDYHKLLRNRLKKLGEKIQEQCASLNFRPFVDSAPIPVSYTHLRAHETDSYLGCRLLLEKIFF